MKIINLIPKKKKSKIKRRLNTWKNKKMKIQKKKRKRRNNRKKNIMTKILMTIKKKKEEEKEKRESGKKGRPKKSEWWLSRDTIKNEVEEIAEDLRSKIRKKEVSTSTDPNVKEFDHREEVVYTIQFVDQTSAEFKIKLEDGFIAEANDYKNRLQSVWNHLKSAQYKVLSIN